MGVRASGPQPRATLGHSVEGIVTLQRAAPIGDASWMTDLRVSVYRPGEEQPFEFQPSRTNAQGRFYFYVTNPGTYDIGIKSPHALENRKANVVVKAGYNPGEEFGTLWEGDADDSNTVDAADHTLLRQRFWHADARTDFNQDGTTNILDYSLLYRNYGLVGPRPAAASMAAVGRSQRGRPVLRSLDITIGSAVVSPGEVFELPITVHAGGDELDGLEVHLTFDPNLLRLVDSGGAEASSIAPGGELGNVLRNEASNAAGTVGYAAGPQPGDPPPTGDILLATLRFRALAGASGTTTVFCNAATAARMGMPYPLRVSNGSVQIATETVTPQPSNTPAVPTATVTPQREGCAIPLVFKRGRSLSTRTGAQSQSFGPHSEHQSTLPILFQRYIPTFWRFGVNIASGYGEIADYDLRQLGTIGWYHTWRVEAHPARPGGIEFVQTIRIRDDPVNPADDHWPPDWSLVEEALRANPGSLWLIGNEPDRPDPYGQDNCTPEEYAARYHQCYTFIKSRDPSAQVSAAAIVQPSALRLRWLDLMLAAYQERYGAPMPVDAWNIHVQIMREVRGEWGCDIPPGIPDDRGEDYQVNDSANVEILRQKIVSFRTWMRDRGFRDKPLIISEYGVTMPSGYGYLGGADKALGDQMVIDFMRGTFDYCRQATDPELGQPSDGDRLVQRWAWYSLNMKMSDFSANPPELIPANGSLFDWQQPYPGALTPFGIAFRDYMRTARP